MEEENILDVELRYVARNFLDQIKGENIEIISHFDTDGITSATIMLKTLKKLDQQFSIKIIKNLTKNFINSLDKNKIILFLDLASGSLNQIKKAGLRKVYIIDHHEVTEKIPENVEIINPELCEKQKISAAGLTYLFSKQIDKSNKNLAKLAIIGMIGDQLIDNVELLNHKILEDSEIQRKKGLLVFPATRPLNKVLEYSSNPFIPGVTGNIKGVMELLRKIGLNPENGKYKSLIDLNENEMKKLITAIILKNPEAKDIVGDLFLVKLFNKFEDARELSAKINACSKSGKPEIAISLCLENSDSKKISESIHIKYKQSLISGIKFVQEMKKIEGKNYVIMNTKERIKDTMIGTIMSIISNSSLYKAGTILIGMSYTEYNETIKISARVVGKQGKNIREILAKTMEDFEGEVGGHEFAAGCSIPKNQEETFIEKLKNILQTPIPKIK